ncbi:hypothetical protein K461DRAFT_143377 [Myriangium duriaei CBS 260.36]|uniref:Acid phosphatase n=1 Tax=Myriangium duriaei CBS 260.36 TaxID=1168546 RepID=A0A9P4IYG4_9PEZI|nr:hypothetical protein K461DRAFT_143377 [Myriangium duriaei CBS 260.36]
MHLSTIIAFTTAVSAVPLLSKRTVPGKNFQQWGFLIFENTDFEDAEANAVFQEIQALNHNRLLSNYQAITHPSLPNYLNSIAGTDFGVSDDGSPTNHAQSASTILDLLENKGISWKMYAEDYPGNCFKGATNGVPHSYAAKHVPAIYFSAITKNPKRCANIVDASQFQKDFQAGTLPQWWYYVPNLNNDGHDTTVDYQADYLRSTWLPMLQNPAFTKDLAMVLTYDESATYDAPNHVFAALIGDALNPSLGREDTTAYDHYSLIKTVEDNWDLGNLGQNDVGATAIAI